MHGRQAVAERRSLFLAWGALVRIRRVRHSICDATGFVAAVLPSLGAAVASVPEKHHRFDTHPIYSESA